MKPSDGPLTGLAGNASWMMAGFGVRLLTQAAYFVIIARGLGVDGYGAFIGSVALVAVAAPFASWGSGNLLVKHVSRDPTSFASQWWRALLVTLGSSVVLFAAVVTVARLVLPASVPWQLIVAVAASDLLCARLVDISAHAFQAFERMRGTAIVQVMPALAKLAAAAAILGAGVRMTVVGWGLAYLAATAVSAVIAVVWVWRSLGRPRSPATAGRWELREGLFFSVSLSAQTITNDTDKTMLARMASLESAGLYGAAYRLIEVAVMPVRSVLAASYARFFRHGAAGVGGSLGFAERLLPAGVAYGLVAAAVLWWGAPVLVVVLGDGFAGADSALRWLAPLPLLKVLASLPADALTGADRQGRRSAVQTAVAVGNIGINLWLIPAYGWRGAAWASIVSDSVLAASLWVIARRARRPLRAAEQLVDVHRQKDLTNA